MLGLKNQGRGLGSSGEKCDGIGFPCLFYFYFHIYFMLKSFFFVMYWDGEGWREFHIPPPPGRVDHRG